MIRRKDYFVLGSLKKSPTVYLLVSVYIYCAQYVYSSLTRADFAGHKTLYSVYVMYKNGGTFRNTNVNNKKVKLILIDEYKYVIRTKWEKSRVWYYFMYVHDTIIRAYYSSTICRNNAYPFFESTRAYM